MRDLTFGILIATGVEVVFFVLLWVSNRLEPGELEARARFVAFVQPSRLPIRSEIEDESAPHDQEESAA